MIAQDMRGSGVHATMLGKAGHHLLRTTSRPSWKGGLHCRRSVQWHGQIGPRRRGCAYLVEQGPYRPHRDAGKRLHTGRSRNDQVALDIRLTLRDASCGLQQQIAELVKVLCRQAAQNTASVMPG